MIKYDLVIISGGFDPLHSGHINYIIEAKSLGKALIVILNSDDFLIAKKGYFLLSYKERLNILQNIKGVDEVTKALDLDQTVCRTLEYLYRTNSGKTLCFAKGGDRLPSNVPEEDICRQLGIKILYNVGGEKIQSSSEIFKKGVLRYGKKAEA